MVRHAWIGMVIVVPAFAVGQQRDPPVIAALVRRLIVAVAPHVAGRIYEPRAVQYEHQPNEHPPDHERPTEIRSLSEIADREQREPQHKVEWNRHLVDKS